MIIQDFKFETFKLYDTLMKEFISKSINTGLYDDTALKQRLSSAETAIATLNGDSNGSVKKQIDDAFNDFATKISDDNVVNTFKELVDYCASHSTEIAEMVGDIEANERAISTLETYVGKLPEDTDAKSVIEYINAKVEVTKSEITTIINALKTALDTYKVSNDAIVSELDDRITALEDIEYVSITEEQINSLFASLDNE